MCVGRGIVVCVYVWEQTTNNKQQSTTTANTEHSRENKTRVSCVSTGRVMCDVATWVNGREKMEVSSFSITRSHKLAHITQPLHFVEDT